MNKTFVMVLVALMLGACSSQEAINKAKKAASPSQALEIVRNAIAEECPNGIRFCSAADALLEARNEYFTKAVRAGETKVLRELYEAPSFGQSLLLQAELKNNVLDNANTSTDPDLLAVAAAIHGNDTLGIVNATAQIEFYSRAWSAGDELSAGRLAHIFARLKDYEKAYLWSLRCINKCNRSKGVLEGESSDQIQLRFLEKNLSDKQITALQQAAALKSK